MKNFVKNKYISIVLFVLVCIVGVTGFILYEKNNNTTEYPLEQVGMYLSDDTHTNFDESNVSDKSFYFHSKIQGVTICGVTGTFSAPRETSFCDVSRIEVGEHNLTVYTAGNKTEISDIAIMDVTGGKVVMDSRTDVPNDLAWYDATKYARAYVSLPNDTFHAAVIQFDRSIMNDAEIKMWLNGLELKKND